MTTRGDPLRVSLWPQPCRGRLGFIAALCLCTALPPAQALPQPDGDIVIGSPQDLAGAHAASGAQLRNGVQMRIDEENARGGVFGRRLRLSAADGAPQAASRKERVFVVLAPMGGAVEPARRSGLPLLFPATFLPAGAAAPLEFRLLPPASLSLPLGLRYLVRTNGFARVAMLYRDDAAGRDAQAGAARALAELDMQWCAKLPLGGDAGAALGRLREAGCDLVLLALDMDDTLAAVRAARAADWNVAMLATPAAYGARLVELGGEAVEGLYAMRVTPHPLAVGANAPLAAWIGEYTRRYGVAPDHWSVYGYVSAELFIRAAYQAGLELSAERLVAALEALRSERDYFGNPAFRFSRDDHLGNRAAALAQVRGGRWQSLTDYLQ